MGSLQKRSITNVALGKAISHALRMLEAISKLTSTTSKRLDKAMRFNTLMISSLRVPGYGGNGAEAATAIEIDKSTQTAYILYKTGWNGI